MKNTIAILKKYALVILAVLICGFSLFQKCDSKQETPQPATIDQRDRNESKEDSLNTARANVLLYQKDSIIQTLKSILAKEKANTATQNAEANKQHVINFKPRTRSSQVLRSLPLSNRDWSVSFRMCCLLASAF